MIEYHASRMFVDRRAAKNSRYAKKLYANFLFRPPNKHQQKAPTFVSMVGAFFEPRTNTQTGSDIRCGFARVSFQLHCLALLRSFGASFVSSSLHCSIAFCLARVPFQCCYIVLCCVLFSASYVYISLHEFIACCSNGTETKRIAKQNTAEQCNDIETKLAPNIMQRQIAST